MSLEVPFCHHPRPQHTTILLCSTGCERRQLPERHHQVHGQGHAGGGRVEAAELAAARPRPRPHRAGQRYTPPYDDRNCILSTVHTCVLIAHCSCFCCGGVCLWLRLCVPRVLCLQALARLWRWARARKCTWATPPAPLTSATRPRRPPAHHRTVVRDMILFSTPIHRFPINMMVLPRQARDKTRGENAEGKGVSFRRAVAYLCQKRLWGLGVFVLALGGRACLCQGAEHACLSCLHIHTVTLPRQARDTT